MTSFFNGITQGLIGYDIETYPNIFTFRSRHDVTGQRWNFEISDWRDDKEQLCQFLDDCRDAGVEMVGFNNLGFDYPVLHFIYQHRGNRTLTVNHIYQKAMDVIQSNNRFAHMVWDSEHVAKQIDLYKIHHFDNPAKATSLKVLEFNMRMESVEDLPFDVGICLEPDQTEILKHYNGHDVDATMLFLQRTKDAIELRRVLSEQFGMQLINCNDVKIGEKILISEMEKAGVRCFDSVDGKKQKRQTVRGSVAFADVIFPYVNFERQEFKQILEYLKRQTISSDEVTGRLKTKGVFTELNANVEGCVYKFGTGGLHMSVESQVVRSTSTHQIVDVDVASYYPNLAIQNRIYPAHSGPAFCDTLLNIFNMRKGYSKKDPRNGALKLALNGVYGLSNNEFSPFLDAQYTMSITVNGQLLLCMFVEQLLKIPGLSMIQANTDGVTFLCPREYLDHIDALKQWWEALTKLELEAVNYKRMFIRDVNSYIAEKEDGSLKRIGAYAYETAEENPATRELPYYKDWSSRVIQKAAEAKLVRGEDIREFIKNHKDDYDFLLRTKVPRSSSLELDGVKVSNVIRYYVSVNGAKLEKVMPPQGPRGAFKRAAKISDRFYNDVIKELCALSGISYPPTDEDFTRIQWDERINTKNRSTYDNRNVGYHTGWNVSLCNHISQFERNNVNIEWYAQEAEKLCLLRGLNE